MAEEQNEVRRINWNEVFSFTHIFKGFRMAIHPSKLLLAFLAIVIIFSAGVVLDSIWSVGGQYVADDEIANHARLSSTNFDDYMEATEDRRPNAAVNLYVDARRDKFSLATFSRSLGSGFLYDAFVKIRDKRNEGARFEELDREAREKLEKRAEDDWDDVLEDAEDLHADELARAGNILEDAYDNAEENIEKSELGEDRKDEAFETLEENYLAARRALTERRANLNRQVAAVRGRTIFAALADYEAECLDNAIKAVCYGNIFGGLDDYAEVMRNRARERATGATADPRSINWNDPAPPDEQPGFLFNVLLAGQGFVWLVYQHWVYAIVFLVIALAVSALLGGAVNRIAALHFAREEKISMSQALRFSASKFLSFFTAPLIPLAIIVFVGILISVGAMLINIPFIGEIIAAVLFFLALGAGMLIAFLLIGLLTGVWLMYPTISVEGSDSFDAISRSFSYIYARPWRTALYGLIALVYGVITYLFVRLFAYLALAATHCFAKWFVWTGGQGLAGDADKVDEIWAAPSFSDLWGTYNWAAMSGSEMIAAFIIGIWVFIVAGIVAAYLLSYAASATTIIYYLLRRKVDATDLDDVYVEEPIEEETVPPVEPEGEAAEGEAPAEADQGGAESDTGESASAGEQAGEDEGESPAEGEQDTPQT